MFAKGRRTGSLAMMAQSGSLIMVLVAYGGGSYICDKTTQNFPYMHVYTCTLAPVHEKGTYV